jgi:hypothetical protein
MSGHFFTGVGGGDKRGIQPGTSFSHCTHVVHVLFRIQLSSDVPYNELFHSNNQTNKQSTLQCYNVKISRLSLTIQTIDHQKLAKMY